MSAYEKARNSQYNSHNYPGIDNWQDSPLHSGNIVYIWEADDQEGHGEGDAYAMTPNTAFNCEGDPNQLKDSLQTDLNPDYDNHRGILRAYEMNDEVDAAFSHCEANTCHGEGGGEQYFIPDFDQQLADGKISRREDLDLHFAEENLSIDSSDKEQDKLNIKEQSDAEEQYMSDDGNIAVSKGTTPTLDGAYTNETEGLGDSMKPKVDDANDQWQRRGNDYYDGMGY